jgi:hypothetical protein
MEAYLHTSQPSRQRDSRQLWQLVNRCHGPRWRVYKPLNPLADLDIHSGRNMPFVPLKISLTNAQMIDPSMWPGDVGSWAVGCGAVDTNREV